MINDPLPCIYHGKILDKSSVLSSKVEEYITSGINTKTIKGEEEKGGKIIICSSGSEGFTPHLNVVKEQELMNLPNQYGENGSRFYSYISCANISGILTNLVNPIVNDCVVMLTDDFDLEDFYFDNDISRIINSRDEKYYDKRTYNLSYRDFDLIRYLFTEYKKEDLLKEEFDVLNVYVRRKGTYNIRIGEEFQKYHIDTRPDTMMFPRNIVEYLNNIDTRYINLSHMKQIFLAGGINSQEDINNIVKKLPLIPIGIITNLYGSTEASGVISSCCEKKMNTCFINISKYKKGIMQIVYCHK